MIYSHGWKILVLISDVILCNSPCNPTGAMFPRDLLERLVGMAVRHNLYLLSDECYDEVILDGKHTSPASFCTDGRVVSAFTFSKTYAMTGWRVGYVVANDEISNSITKVLESNSSCLPKSEWSTSRSFPISKSTSRGRRPRSRSS